MKQFIKNKLRNAQEASRLLGIASTIRIHLKKALPSQSQSIIQISIDGISDDFLIRTRGTDFEVCLQMFFGRDYELGWCEPYKKHMHDLCDDMVRKGDVPLIIDAGANIGASTALLARAFPQCQVFAIEPDMGNYRMLQENVRKLGNVSVFQAGLWDKAASLAVEWPQGSGWAQRVGEVPHSPGNQLASVTVQQLLDLNPKLRPAIVKIDIEGTEVQALRSDNAWIDQVPLMIFEAHDNLWHWLGTWQGSAHAFLSCLTRRKREYLSKGENVFAFLHPSEV